MQPAICTQCNMLVDCLRNSRVRYYVAARVYMLYGVSWHFLNMTYVHTRHTYKTYKTYKHLLVPLVCAVQDLQPSKKLTCGAILIGTAPLHHPSIGAVIFPFCCLGHASRFYVSPSLQCACQATSLKNRNPDTEALVGAAGN